MALLNKTEAAEAAGVDRSTIYRKIKAGELSVVLDAAGEERIDTAELLRVFKVLVGASVASDNTQPHPATPSDAELVALLKDQLKAAGEREQRLLALLESAQAQLALPETTTVAQEPTQDQLRRAEEREQRLMTLLESAQAQLAQAPEPKRRGLWARIFGE